MSALSSPAAWWLKPRLTASQTQPAAQHLTLASAAASVPRILYLDSVYPNPQAAQVSAASQLSVQVFGTHEPAAVDIRLLALPSSALQQVGPCRLPAASDSIAATKPSINSSLPSCDPLGQPGAQPPSLQSFQQLPACQVLSGGSDSSRLHCSLPEQLVAGQYRVVAWSAADGYFLGMPRLDVLPVVTSISPQTGDNQHVMLLRHQCFVDRPPMGTQWGKHSL